MNAIEVIMLNFSETRRRSIKLWSKVPDGYMNWKPDEDALSIIEMIRHVLEGEHLFYKIIQNRGDLGEYKSPWEGLEYIDLYHELQFAKSYRDDFMEMVSNLNEEDLKHIIIDRKEVGQRKILGDYLNRMTYHESVHMGQMLSYLRTAMIERPNIWD